MPAAVNALVTSTASFLACVLGTSLFSHGDTWLAYAVFAGVVLDVSCMALTSDKAGALVRLPAYFLGSVFGAAVALAWQRSE